VAALEFVHEFIAAKPDGPGFTLLLLHGTGGDERDLLPIGQSLAPGAAILSPRGQVLENGQARFFRRLAPGVFDEEDVRLRANELADFVAAAAARYGFDGQRVIAAGCSNGANIAAAMLLLRPESLERAALFRPMVPLTPEPAPDLSGKPVLLSAGRSDPITSPAEVKRLARLLADCGARVDVNWCDAGHWVEREEIAAARQWLGS
jgi:predicted esterase